MEYELPDQKKAYWEHWFVERELGKQKVSLRIRWAMMKRKISKFTNEVARDLSMIIFTFLK